MSAKEDTIGSVRIRSNGKRGYLVLAENDTIVGFAPTYSEARMIAKAVQA